MVDALPFSEVRGLLEFWLGKKRGQLTKVESAMLPSPTANLPAPPPYVLEAMKRHKEEQSRAARG